MCLTNSFCLPTSYSKSVSYFIVNYSGRSVRLYEMLIFFCASLKGYFLSASVVIPGACCRFGSTGFFFFNFNHRFKIHSISYIYFCFLVNFVMVLINHRCYKAPLFTIIIIIIVESSRRNVNYFCCLNRLAE